MSEESTQKREIETSQEEVVDYLKNVLSRLFPYDANAPKSETGAAQYMWAALNARLGTTNLMMNPHAVSPLELTSDEFERAAKQMGPEIFRVVALPEQLLSSDSKMMPIAGSCVGETRVMRIWDVIRNRGIPPDKVHEIFVDILSQGHSVTHLTGAGVGPEVSVHLEEKELWLMRLTNEWHIPINDARKIVDSFYNGLGESLQRTATLIHGDNAKVLTLDFDFLNLPERVPEWLNSIGIFDLGPIAQNEHVHRWQVGETIYESEPWRLAQVVATYVMPSLHDAVMSGIESKYGSAVSDPLRNQYDGVFRFKQADHNDHQGADKAILIKVINGEKLTAEEETQINGIFAYRAAVEIGLALHNSPQPDPHVAVAGMAEPAWGPTQDLLHMTAYLDPSVNLNPDPSQMPDEDFFENLNKVITDPRFLTQANLVTHLQYLAQLMDPANQASKRALTDEKIKLIAETKKNEALKAAQVEETQLKAKLRSSTTTIADKEILLRKAQITDSFLHSGVAEIQENVGDVSIAVEKMIARVKEIVLPIVSRSERSDLDIQDLANTSVWANRIRETQNEVITTDMTPEAQVAILGKITENIRHHVQEIEKAKVATEQTRIKAARLEEELKSGILDHKSLEGKQRKLEEALKEVEIRTGVIAKLSAELNDLESVSELFGNLNKTKIKSSLSGSDSDIATNIHVAEATLQQLVSTREELIAKRNTYLEKIRQGRPVSDKNIWSEHDQNVLDGVERIILSIASTTHRETQVSGELANLAEDFHRRNSAILQNLSETLERERGKETEIRTRLNQVEQVLAPMRNRLEQIDEELKRIPQTFPLDTNPFVTHAMNFCWDPDFRDFLRDFVELQQIYKQDKSRREWCEKEMSQAMYKIYPKIAAYYEYIYGKTDIVPSSLRNERIYRSNPEIPRTENPHMPSVLPPGAWRDPELGVSKSRIRPRNDGDDEASSGDTLSGPLSPPPDGGQSPLNPGGRGVGSGRTAQQSHPSSASKSSLSISEHDDGMRTPATDTLIDPGLESLRLPSAEDLLDPNSPEFIAAIGRLAEIIYTPTDEKELYTYRNPNSYYSKSRAAELLREAQQRVTDNGLTHVVRRALRHFDDQYSLINRTAPQQAEISSQSVRETLELIINKAEAVFAEARAMWDEGEEGRAKMIEYAKLGLQIAATISTGLLKMGAYNLKRGVQAGVNWEVQHLPAQAQAVRNTAELGATITGETFKTLGSVLGWSVDQAAIALAEHPQVRDTLGRELITSIVITSVLTVFFGGNLPAAITATPYLWGMLKGGKAGWDKFREAAQRSYDKENLQSAYATGEKWEGRLDELSSEELEIAQKELAQAQDLLNQNETHDSKYVGEMQNWLGSLQGIVSSDKTYNEALARERSERNEQLRQSLSNSARAVAQGITGFFRGKPEKTDTLPMAISDGSDTDVGEDLSLSALSEKIREQWEGQSTRDENEPGKKDTSDDTLPRIQKLAEPKKEQEPIKARTGDNGLFDGVPTEWNQSPEKVIDESRGQGATKKAVPSTTSVPREETDIKSSNASVSKPKTSSRPAPKQVSQTQTSPVQSSAPIGSFADIMNNLGNAVNRQESKKHAIHRPQTPQEEIAEVLKHVGDDGLRLVVQEIGGDTQGKVSRTSVERALADRLVSNPNTARQILNAVRDEIIAGNPNFVGKEKEMAGTHEAMFVISRMVNKVMPNKSNALML